ncbi:DUF4430 domain-containing protein [Spiroplasma platyhelix]|uniref:DUF4430 domain-containing protein n=1 Tax=Spiroplasma platyhelix PALS-1 TaxID=1276218 RepID=A0A846TWQ8_9MOLU|nr:DUF4430 domain-containing protein [Spiroplasma platyhelix]MBE4704101.1 hypothetical protein [Spiroplasma platyhelix PALS-1]NKE38471.1 DUF4430 domain-containing protein [Spiroplasma platyhelix PALS-1]UJB29359.1 hypothetical protein SPLAT_v1c05950 [Spiroplasma platyhelix PALS-1]
MKKEKNQFKNKKNFWRWVAGSLFLILFGTSAIINIAYLPKYFVLKNQNELEKNQLLNINVSAYNEENGSTKLFTYIYQTTQKTLANLMIQDSKTFYLTHNGTWLDAISYYNNQEKQTIASKDPYYWMVYNNGEISGVGIADLLIHNGDKIELRYQHY